MTEIWSVLNREKLQPPHTVDKAVSWLMLIFNNQAAAWIFSVLPWAMAED